MSARWRMKKDTLRPALLALAASAQATSVFPVPAALERPHCARRGDKRGKAGAQPRPPLAHEEEHLAPRPAGAGRQCSSQRRLPRCLECNHTLVCWIDRTCEDASLDKHMQLAPGFPHPLGIYVSALAHYKGYLVPCSACDSCQPSCNKPSSFLCGQTSRSLDPLENMLSRMVNS